MFSVVGPSFDGTIPIVIKGFEQVFSTAGQDPRFSLANAAAQVQISAGHTTILHNVTSSNGSQDNSSLNFNDHLDVTANLAFFIFLSLNAEAISTASNGFSGGSLLAGGIVDPFIFVDPSFANAGLYSIGVSSGIGNIETPNPSPVPLPAIGAGIPGLIFATGGMLAWWRRKRCAEAAA
jgi:hypothetical protein